MHMADALVSPVVAGIMWGASAAAIAVSSRRLRQQPDDRKVPLMGVLGAFIFAAQMITFAIPGTGSSGHLGGGLLLAVLLGPSAAFLTIASVLIVQALFFADGGLLALGCNIFNLGFFPVFLCYPLIYQKLAGRQSSRRARVLAAIVTAIAGLQLGSLGVVLETVASGISELPFAAFILLMQPVHLAIGVVEGIVTAAVVAFIGKARPDLLDEGSAAHSGGSFGRRLVVIGFFIAAIAVAGFFSRFASDKPDGLEWSIARITGHEQLHSPQNAFNAAVAALQGKTAIFPDYSFKKGPDKAVGESPKTAGEGTSTSGIIGGLITLALVFLMGLFLGWRKKGRG